MQVEVAGVLASSDNPALAREFLEFMVSDPFQSAIPEGNWMYPAKTPAAGLPAAFSGLAKPSHSFLASPETVQDSRRLWIDEWLAAMSL